MKFTQLTNSLDYPRTYKSTLLLYHSNVVSEVLSNFINSSRYKRSVVYAINVITYIVVSGDHMPLDWSASNPMKNLPDLDDSEVEEFLKKKNLYVNFNEIDWDIEESIKPSSMYVPVKSDTEKKSDISAVSNISTKQSVIQKDTSSVKTIKALQSSSGGDLLDIESVNAPSKLMLSDVTPKEDLYIQHPVIPRFNIKKVYASGKDDNDILLIYESCPEVPTKQSEISITTDVNKFTSSDLMKLYPKQFIQTRSPVMYEPIDGLNFHRDLGILLPISDYTEEELIDNIIKYPHIYQLLKHVDGKYVNFYSTIEIDGSLHRIQDVWEDLPDTSSIPKTTEFMKEYVVRRYLLERDISKITHKYPLWGTLEPYLTLFTTPEDYIRLGYNNVEEIARRCVLSRISYRKSRNPVMRRLNNV